MPKLEKVPEAEAAAMFQICQELPVAETTVDLIHKIKKQPIVHLSVYNWCGHTLGYMHFLVKSVVIKLSSLF